MYVILSVLLVIALFLAFYCYRLEAEIVLLRNTFNDISELMDDLEKELMDNEF